MLNLNKPKIKSYLHLSLHLKGDREGTSLTHSKLLIHGTKMLFGVCLFPSRSKQANLTISLICNLPCRVSRKKSREVSGCETTY